MGLFITSILSFILAIIAVVVYYKFTDKGRKADVERDLTEANLQGNLLDSIEETRKVQNELHERVKALRKQ